MNPALIRKITVVQVNLKNRRQVFSNHKIPGHSKESMLLVGILLHLHQIGSIIVGS